MTSVGAVAQAPKRPWYREPLVWMVIAIPASAVVMGIVLAVLAVTTFDGMVDDDYYRDGLHIGRTLARDAEAERLGLTGTVDVDPRSGAVVASVAGNAAFVPPARLTLRFLHATRAGADVALSLDRAADGRWSGRVPPLRAGGWYVQLETPAWRLTARITGPARGEVALHPVPTGG